MYSTPTSKNDKLLANIFHKDPIHIFSLDYFEPNHR